MTTQQKMKVNWMKAYESTLLLLGHEAGKIDWNTADYLFLKNEHPVMAAKNLMARTIPSYPSVVAILKQDQMKNISSEDFKNS